MRALRTNEGLGDLQGRTFTSCLPSLLGSWKIYGAAQRKKNNSNLTIPCIYSLPFTKSLLRHSLNTTLTSVSSSMK